MRPILPPPLGDLGLSLIHGFFGPPAEVTFPFLSQPKLVLDLMTPEVHTQNSIWIGSAILAQLMVAINRHTDNATSAAIGLMFIYTLCMRCGL